MAALALAAAALVAGCSGGKVATKGSLRPLALREQVSSIAKSGKEYVVTWAGVLSNPNRWQFGENAVATISARDARGKEVVHLEQPLDAVAPSGSLAFTGTATATAQPVNVKIGYRQATWRQAARIPSAFKPFSASEVRTEKLSNGTYLVTGYVADPFRKAASSLMVTALLHDRNGRLLGGDGDFVDDVDAGGRRRFVITVDDVTGPVAPGRTEVLASPWGSTGRPYEDLALAGAVPVNTAKPKTPPFPKE
jgi:hypothetical protein